MFLQKGDKRENAKGAKEGIGDAAEFSEHASPSETAAVYVRLERDSEWNCAKRL